MSFCRVPCLGSWPRYTVKPTQPQTQFSEEACVESPRRISTTANPKPPRCDRGCCKACLGFCKALAMNHAMLTQMLECFSIVKVSKRCIRVSSAGLKPQKSPGSAGSNPQEGSGTAGFPKRVRGYGWWVSHFPDPLGGPGLTVKKAGIFARIGRNNVRFEV